MIGNGTLHVALTDAEFNLVLSGLGELPAKSSFGLLNRLIAEFQQEQKRRADPLVGGPPKSEDVPE